MDDLLEFLRARYDEREQLANRAMRGPWRLDYIRADRAWQLSGTSDPHGIARILDNGVNEGTLRHIADNDPTWVLADLESKRRILNRHASYDFPADPEDGPGAYSWTGRCDHCHEVWPCPDLRDLALPYAGHPDYQDEWKP